VELGDNMINHIGLQYPDKSKAETFFEKVLGLPLQKEFTVPSELSLAVFGLDQSVEVIAWGDDNFKFEIFITGNQKVKNYEHIGWPVSNKAEFIERCKNNGIDPIIAKKGEKELLFVRDPAGYLYEIKEE
jgi:catechol 2,3-dioxygenase-like lactoylglutathione lyase family enzyme